MLISELDNLLVNIKIKLVKLMDCVFEKISELH